MAEWNVRVVKTYLKYAEFIVEADSKEEAEAQINPDSAVTDEDHWSEVEEETYIHPDYTERMDELFPEDYDNDGEHE